MYSFLKAFLVLMKLLSLSQFHAPKEKQKQKNEWTQNMVKKMYRWNRMPMYTNEWIEFKWRILVWLEYF